MQERIPQSDYQNLHHFISHSPWDWRGVMGEVACQMAASFALLPGEAPCGLILDESGWEKSGKKSVGVARQYIGQVGKVANGQVGVFAALSKADRVGLVGGRLYLPKEWTDDPTRCAEAKIPLSERHYRTKADLAIELLQDLAGQVRYDWVGGDSIYGNPARLRQYLQQRGQAFILDVGQLLRVYLQPPAPYLPQTAPGKGRPRHRYVSDQEPVVLQELVTTLPAGQWQTLTYRQGTKGPLKRQAVLLDVWLWNADQHDKVEPLQLLLSRELDGSELKCSLCFQASEPMMLASALYRQMQRYWVERAFQDVKEQLGLHQYQVRSWMAWYHHIALTMMALHYIIQTQIEQKEALPLLSCADVKLILAKTLSNKLNSPKGLTEALRHRHRRRQAAIKQYLNHP